MHLPWLMHPLRADALGIGVPSLLLAALLSLGCGGSESEHAGSDAGTTSPGSGPDAGTWPTGGGTGDGGGGGGGPALSDTQLETLEGCGGVYNSNQVLDYYLNLPPGDWSALLADQTNSVYFAAEFHCGDDAPITVGVRRKRSGGTNKVGLKVDINELASGQTHYGLKKLSLENGVSEGSTEDATPASNYLAEYLGWRMMVLSGLVTGRAVFARLYVNNELLGVYVNVEQVDKRFLESRLGDDSGWLYKKSGGVDDGLKTHENDGLENPYDDYFCFWESGGNACAVPSTQALADELPAHLNIEQFLRMGAVNAIIANADSILFKNNNFYYYDWANGRYYLPWDLDTVMKDNFDVFAGDGIGGNTDTFTQVIFSHWEDDYDAILTALIAGPLSLEAINRELDRAEATASDAFASDPYMSESLADAVSDLKAYWAERHATVQAQVDAH